MRGRVQVLVAGLLVALAATLAGCVAQTADDGDEAVDQAPAELVIGPSGTADDDDSGEIARPSSGTNPVLTAVSGKPDGHDVMGEPEPMPWNPAPRGTPSDQTATQNSSTKQH